MIARCIADELRQRNRPPPRQIRSRGGSRLTRVYLWWVPLAVALIALLVCQRGIMALGEKLILLCTKLFQFRHFGSSCQIGRFLRLPLDPLLKTGYYVRIGSSPSRFRSRRSLSGSAQSRTRVRRGGSFFSGGLLSGLDG